MNVATVENAIDRPPVLHRHREMLAIAAVTLVLAFALQVRPDQRVAFRGLAGYPLPPACVARTWFHVDCPACGLTRSLVHLAHGDWSAATRIHRLGPLFAVAILLQFPYRLYGLHRRDPAPLGRTFPWLFGTMLIVALVGNWLYNLVAAGSA
jgi:hypothetical protein